ncbi:NnrS family protein [Mitsuaria sp. WAJ17]|uniref:NnrS family protein n=1 Tax=Mitsuaria sp. WAJ17 TaxID=2761452 RepID=UPI0015FEF2F9|nr:NnrS family protein [Mitsuaria sp. WAJ17]MBB2485018.1 NnrS family protein [Mitsuaria sp. WAJ17]
MMHMTMSTESALGHFDRHPLWRLGFRPLYACAAFAALMLPPLWVLLLSGGWSLPEDVSPIFWHMHEMIFGFAGATIVGFLFTAGRVWTGLPTPRGLHLASYAGLWLAARIAGVTGPYPVFMVLDLAFLPLAAACFFDLILQSRNYRNLGIAAILAALAALNLASHLAHAGLLPMAARTPMHGAVLLITLLESVIAGRIIPSFTMNALKGVQISAHPLMDRLTIATTLTAGLAWMAWSAHPLTALTLGAASALHLSRSWRWKAGALAQMPLLWILHLSYLWIGLGLALLSASAAGLLPASVAIHALSVGAMGGLILGMITRTALGHTGRVLSAGRLEIVAYALVMGAALTRVLLPLAGPSGHALAIPLAAGLWALAFGLYLIRYLPMLMAARVDGREG